MDFFPSSSPISSIYAIEIEVILFLFMTNCLKSSLQECITIIVLKIERTRNQPPYCLLRLQEKMAFRLPRSGCLGTFLTLPQSLYGRTDGRTDGRTLTSEPKYQRVTKFVYPWCSASSAIKSLIRLSAAAVLLSISYKTKFGMFRFEMKVKLSSVSM